MGLLGRGEVGVLFPRTVGGMRSVAFFPRLAQAPSSTSSVIEAVVRPLGASSRATAEIDSTERRGCPCASNPDFRLAVGPPRRFP